MRQALGKDGYERLSANEQMTLAYVWNGEEVSNAVLQQYLSLNSIEAGRILHNMVAQGLLLQNNKGRWTTYAISREIAKSEERSDKRNSPNLTPIEIQILMLMKENENITYEVMEKELSIGRTTIYKAVTHLKKLGVIERTGGRTHGCWKILLREFVS